MSIHAISTKVACAAALALAAAACSPNGSYGGSPRSGGAMTDGVGQPPPIAVTPSDGARDGGSGDHGASPMAPGGSGNGATPAPGAPGSSY
ncbi:hypothetical protein WS62_26585 [Burkholderia sp. ABCPW 14]|uniref:hypothetical protein n=1 Tax=Burkholderia sp. ABCPW 14 TaxID=1637860 RepID=UPI000770DE02|nr:hypothetical protein [Burkholderia sp. ABCPW 14]KVD80620.1 hypothetical protein WS62_26585 [Burkholderia sp. ABCPW 14]